MKRDRPKASTDIHGPSGLKFLPLKKANTIADWKINLHHVTCVRKTMNGRWRLLSQALSEAVDDTSPENVRPSAI
jgi:hypothetical protein